MTDPVTPSPVVALDELTVTVVVDNETDTLSSIAAGVPQAPEAAAIVARTSPHLWFDGHPCVTVFDQLCVACHGLSLLLEATIGDQRHSLLMDVGPDADVWLTNAERLDIDLTSIDTVVLSHWHWDHSGGMPGVLAAVSDARHRAGVTAPVVADVHPDRPDQRGVLAASGAFLMLSPEPTLEALEQAGARVERHDEAHPLAGGCFLVSGAIARVTSYETGLDGHHSFRGGAAMADPLIMDERMVTAEVRGRGVSVFSACSHGGIVNACIAAQAHHPGAPIDLVLGGFHLAGAAVEGRIAATVGDLDDLIDPRVVAPAHCTGWRAKAALAERFAPERYGPSAVGTRYVLTATT